ncbi:MAG: type IV secretory system conjugative DNA transfer family protein [Pseudomonadota bacterium]
MADGMQQRALGSARWADPGYIADKYFYIPGDIWLGRNPHNADSAIGVDPESHIFMCAGTGSGKGRTIIVPNLVLWPGSTVTYDPKGDLPAICAASRGQGDKDTEGLGQKVFVLDPLGHAKSDDKYNGYFDPLWGLDPNDDLFRAMVDFMAKSLVKLPEDKSHAEWAERGIELVAVVIEHVVTTRFYDEDPDLRNIYTVMNLLQKGYKDDLIGAYDAMLESGDITAAKHKTLIEDMEDPFIVLFETISKNEHNEHLRAAGDHWLSLYRRQPKFFESCRDEAVKGLNWITKAVGMETTLRGTRNGKKHLEADRRFDPRELKNNPDGVSVFIVLESDQMRLFAPWVQAVFMGIFAAMRRTPLHEDIHHPTLCIMDEFSSLGYQEYIPTALDTLRDANMRIMIVVQQMGWLEDLYGKRIESFLGNSFIKLFFGDPGDTASDYIVKRLGETEIIKYAVTKSRSKTDTEGDSGSRADSETDSVADTEGVTISFGETEGVGGAETDTEGWSEARSKSRARSKSQNWNWNNSTNWSDGRNWGKGDGKSMGRNYGPHIFFEGLTHTSNYGSTLNRSQGGSHNEGGAKSRGGGGSEGQTDTDGLTKTRQGSKAKTKNWNKSTQRTEARQRSRTITRATGVVHTKGWNNSVALQEGESVAQGFHKKALLEYHEITTYLGKIADKDHDHPSYPGLVLALIGNEDPVFLRRTNYDQDRFFEGLFSESPKFKMIPYEKQPVLGYELKPDTIIHLEVPEILDEISHQVTPRMRAHHRFARGDNLFTWTDKNAGNNVHHDAVALLPGRVLEVNEDPEDRSFMKIQVYSRSPTDWINGQLEEFFQPFVSKEEAYRREVKRQADAKAFADKQAREAQQREAAAKRQREEQEKQDRARKEWDYHHTKRRWHRERSLSRVTALFGVAFWMIVPALVIVNVAASWLWHDFENDGLTWLSYPAGFIAVIYGLVQGLKTIDRLHTNLENEGRELQYKLGPPERPLDSVRGFHSLNPLEDIGNVFEEIWNGLDD